MGFNENLLCNAHATELPNVFRVDTQAAAVFDVSFKEMKETLHKTLPNVVFALPAASTKKRKRTPCPHCTVC